nr:MAG TPA: lipoprotein [Caudoviricetes sp.]DAW42293.1 MAG TPA: lipoprotein [Caudoviricetes sp.]
MHGSSFLPQMRRFGCPPPPSVIKYKWLGGR